MKNRSKILILLCIGLIICILGIGYYYLHPKTGSLNGFLFNNYNKEEIRKIEIRSTHSRKEKLIEDKDEMNKIISDFSNIKLIEYYGSTSNTSKGAYYIYFYDKYDVPIQVTIKGKEYINIINDVDKSNKNYKIIDNSLDVNDIYKLLSK
ncbi:hypothetical protein HYH39_17885 [Clostridium botulinum]|uniref:hypothetical protein n=1 Tax=Clostridium botulinum TaxID=1491 RepID=UPI0005025CFF|nr:hypothetical protein [Clostridium botulinum]KFX54738.1 hypothetical protein KU40_13325 [Clostridium botulinum]MBN1072731.1 hypothetical protein [Clostridium botulinum]MBY6780791.1 hypothetical protein [Clostridium botulinum]MBY6853973.1 hypothetical protein [Clostridium botulinum]NFR88306.1 hypothetical protein [Clostridium botulinum]